MLLIIIGGIGFLTWEDIYLNRFQWKRYRLQSKLILCTTAFLIVVPAVFFYFEDFRGLTGMHGVWNALFQSVTTRTAGYNTADPVSYTHLDVYKRQVQHIRQPDENVREYIHPLLQR